MKKMNFVLVLLAVGLLTALASCNESSAKEAATPDVPQSNEPVSNEQQPVEATGAVSDEPMVTPRVLSISGCIYPLRIVQGDSFAFPEVLDELGLVPSRTSNGYIIAGITESDDAQIPKTSVSITDTGIIIDSDGPSTVRVTKGGAAVIERNGTKTFLDAIGNYILYTWSKGTFQDLVITVPPGIDLAVDAMNRLRVEAPIDSLQVTAASNTAVLFVAKAKQASIDVGGAGSFTIDSVTLIDQLNLSGSSKITVGVCDSVGLITATGTGMVSLPRNTKIGTRTLSGTASIQ